MSKKNKEISNELIERFEKIAGVKVVDTENLIIEYAGKRWRPVKNRVEIMCASFDNEPILILGKTQWIGENWKPNDN